MTELLTDQQLLRELEPTAEKLLDRHLAAAEEWFPHEFVPYGRGEDFEPGHTWTPEDSGVRIDNESVRSALVVNLLTEDNLPYYFRTIERMFGADGAWGTWSKRWTAEEGRHSMAIYGYLMATRAVDPVKLERDRMVQVSTGEVPEPETAIDGFVYVALQELATRIAHRNTGKLLGDSAGFNVMKRVATDENLHHIFYKDMVSTAIEIDPSMVVRAIERQVVNFEMPGTGIPDFDTHKGKIALAGIYGINEFHTGVLDTVLVKNWKIFNLEGLDSEAEKSLAKINRRMAAIGKLATKETELREAHEENSAQTT